MILAVLGDTVDIDDDNADDDNADDDDADDADADDDTDDDNADDDADADDDDTKQVNGGVVEVARAETDSQAKSPNHALWLDFVMIMIRLFDNHDY